MYSCLGNLYSFPQSYSKFFGNDNFKNLCKIFEKLLIFLCLALFTCKKKRYMLFSVNISRYRIKLEKRIFAPSLTNQYF